MQKELRADVYGFLQTLITETWRLEHEDELEKMLFEAKELLERLEVLE